LLIFLGCDDTCNQRLSSICDLRWSYSFGLVRFKVSCGTGSLWTVSFWMGMFCHFDTASTQVWKVDPFDHCCTTDFVHTLFHVCALGMAEWVYIHETHHYKRTSNHHKLQESSKMQVVDWGLGSYFNDTNMKCLGSYSTSCYIMLHHVTSSYVYSMYCPSKSTKYSETPSWWDLTPPGSADWWFWCASGTLGLQAVGQWTHRPMRGGSYCLMMLNVVNPKQ